MEVLDNYGLILINQSPGEERQALGESRRVRLNTNVWANREATPFKFLLTSPDRTPMILSGLVSLSDTFRH